MSKPSAKSYKGDILLVDDTPDNLRVLASLLENQGYRIRKTLNGTMALTACENLLPDLILLDILMPDMDGYEVCKRLKDSERTRDVPVIFISALDKTLDKVKAFKVGGADYISKPFQTEEVIARVTHQLTIQQQHRQLIEQNAQLQKLNETITRYNAEIAKSNAELEQFAYMASHDLQSPLQLTIGYADILLWKYETNLNEEMKRYIGEIVKAGTRMQLLIKDLLAYSRLGARPPQLQAADCQLALAEALANLSEEISASGAVITHSDLPTVTGDRTQLMQLFQNLIGNAIKFRRPDISPSFLRFSSACTRIRHTRALGSVCLSAKKLSNATAGRFGLNLKSERERRFILHFLAWKNKSAGKCFKIDASFLYRLNGWPHRWHRIRREAIARSGKKYLLKMPVIYITIFRCLTSAKRPI